MRDIDYFQKRSEHLEERLQEAREIMNDSYNIMFMNLANANVNHIPDDNMQNIAYFLEKEKL